MLIANLGMVFFPRLMRSIFGWRKSFVSKSITKIVLICVHAEAKTVIKTEIGSILDWEVDWGEG